VIQINDSARKLLGISDGTNIVLTLGDTLSLLGVGYADGKIDTLSADKSVSDDGEHSERSSFTLHEIVYGDRALDITASAFRYYESDTAKNGIILVIHDVTSRYELDKAQREFVANVSHELRTPLTVIKGAAETLSLYPDMDPSMQSTFISNITDESDRMMRIVGDLLTLSGSTTATRNGRSPSLT
jgi:signal transduction histidine kinase